MLSRALGLKDDSTGRDGYKRRTIGTSTDNTAQIKTQYDAIVIGAGNLTAIMKV